MHVAATRRSSIPLAEAWAVVLPRQFWAVLVRCVPLARIIHDGSSRNR